MSLSPLFEDRAGSRSADPLALSGPTPVVDLEALGLLLAPPAMLGEFVPKSPWSGTRRIQPELPKPASGLLPVAFSAAVADLAVGAEAIGVLLSGGLDSLAVLVHALRVAEGRRVVAFTTDLTDDAGGSSADVVRRLFDDLELPVELVVLDPLRDRGEPPWSAAGPRLDALPEVNAAVAERATELGVGVLLSGDGADELLGVPRFATGAVVRRHGIRGGLQYGADVAKSGPGLPGEVAGFIGQVLPASVRARAYWAANWPAWCNPKAPAVLASPYREAATWWAQQWVDTQVAGHAAVGRSWAEADAHDALFPREVIPPAGPVPEASPFLHDGFLAAALALPLGDRYHPGLPSAYLRCKAQVVRLLPMSVLGALPRRKQYFSLALAHQAAAGRRAPRCVEAGLLDADALAAEHDAAVLLVIAAVERWLAGAEKAGAAIG